MVKIKLFNRLWNLLKIMQMKVWELCWLPRKKLMMNFTKIGIRNTKQLKLQL